MSISIETTSTLGRRLHVAVPAEEVTKAFDSSLREYARTARIDGFRPGKAQLSVVRKLYGAGIRGKVVDDLFQKSLHEAIVGEKLQLVERSLAIENMEAEEGKPLKYSATFEVYPEIHVKKLDAEVLEKLVVTITDADVDQVLEQIRKQHATWKVVDRAAQWEDKVTFDLLVKTADAAEPHIQQEKATLILDESRLPAGFTALKGAKAGDSVVLSLMNPAGEHNPEQLEYSAKVHEIAEAELPDIDSKFAAQLGVPEGTVEALRDQIRKHMQQELEATLKNKLKMQLVDKLLALHQFELPKAMVEAEAEHLQKEIRAKAQQDLQRQDIGELPEAVKEQSIVNAKRRVTLGLLFGELIKLHDIKVDEAKVRQQAERIAASFEDPQATVNLLYGYKEVMQSIRSQVIEEQVIEKILEQVQFSEKTASYSEIMKVSTAHHDHHHHDHDGPCDHDHDHSHDHAHEGAHDH